MSRMGPVLKLQSVLLILFVISGNIFETYANNEDYYCGLSFFEVRDNCLLPCASGDDSECSNVLGADYVCFYFTGCAEKIANGFVPSLPDLQVPAVETPVAPAVETKAPTPVPSEEPIPAPTEKPTPAPVDAVETSAPTPQPDAVETAAPTPQPIVAIAETDAPTQGPTSAVVTSNPTSPPKVEVETIAQTNKPTRRPRTKKPTQPPGLIPVTLEPVAVSSPKPSQIQAVTYSPSYSSIESLGTATSVELVAGSDSDNTLSTSYGFIFTVKTTFAASAIEITGFEFLTASTDSMKFELYTRSGVYSGSKGNYGRWNLVADGYVKGQGLGGYTSIPKNLMKKVPIDGLGSVRSFYFTLNTKKVIYRATGTGSNSGQKVQQETDELELYEGESVHGFPFPLGSSYDAYMGPHQFIGAIIYDTLPCKPLSAYGIVNTLPCPIIPTISPSPTSSAPISLSPTVTFMPSLSPSERVTPEPSYMPTTAQPTISPPPTASPTESPEVAVTSDVNVVITLRNTLNRNMTTAEETEFKDGLLDFLSQELSLEDDGVSVETVKLWYQQQIDLVDGGRKLRKLQELASSEITVILQVSHFESAKPSVGDVIVAFFEKAEVPLINIFRGQDELPFFYQIDQLYARVIEQVTLAPVAAPISAIETREVSDGATSSGGMSSGSMSSGAYAGIGVGVLLLCVIAFGTSYFIFKNRLTPKSGSQGTLEVDQLLESKEVDLEVGLVSETSSAGSKKRSEELNGPSEHDTSENENDNSMAESSHSSSSSSSKSKETDCVTDEKKKLFRSIDFDPPVILSEESTTTDDEGRSHALDVSEVNLSDVAEPMAKVTAKDPYKMAEDNSSSSDSSSDSDDSTDSALRAKIMQRKLQRAESNMALTRGVTAEKKSSLDLSGVNIAVQEKRETSSQIDTPVAVPRRRRKVAKFSQSETTSGKNKMKSSAEHHLSGSDSNLESTRKTPEQDDETKLPIAKRSSSDLNESHQDIKMTVSSDIRGSGRREARRRKSKSQSLTSDAERLRESSQKRRPKHSRRKTSDDLHTSDKGKNLNNSLKASMKAPIDSNTEKDNWKSLKASVKTSTDTNTGKDNWKTLNNSLKASVKAPVDSNAEKDNWKSLKASIKTSTDTNTEKDKWKTLNNSLKASMKAPIDSNAEKDNWKSLKASVKASDDTKRSQRRTRGTSKDGAKVSTTNGSSNDFKESRRRSAEDSSRPRRRVGSEDLRQSSRQGKGSDLKKSRRSSNDDSLKKSERLNAGDLTRSRTNGKSRRRTLDDDIKKSKRLNSDELTRSKTKGNSEKSKLSSSIIDASNNGTRKARQRDYVKRLNSA